MEEHDKCRHDKLICFVGTEAQHERARELAAIHGFRKVEDEVKTFREWNLIQPEGIEVLDPDGFDRSPSSSDLTTRLYTRQEWLDRAMGSTIQPHLGWDRA